MHPSVESPLYVPPFPSTPPIRYNTPIQNNLSNTANINSKLYLPKIGSQEKTPKANSGEMQVIAGDEFTSYPPVNPPEATSTYINPPL